MVSEAELEEVGTYDELEYEVTQHTFAELIQTARRARQRGATVLFRGLRVHSLNEVLQLAAAGGRWHGVVWVS